MSIATKTALAALSLLVATSAHAGSRFEKVDIVKEGIDQQVLEVNAINGAYSSFYRNEYTFMVRVFAKGKGSNHVYAAGIGNKPKSHISEVGGNGWLWRKHNTDDGWGVFKRSLSLKVKATKMSWLTTPGEACRRNLSDRMAAGMARDKVLRKDWDVKARAEVRFYAGAANKTRIRNNSHIGKDQTRSASVVYPVMVRCLAKF